MGGRSYLPSKVDEERPDVTSRYPAVPHLPLSIGLCFLTVVSSQAGEGPVGCEQKSEAVK